ncbi:MAG: hypothetical protein RJA19_409 [Bacteroidota bacterium]
MPLWRRSELTVSFLRPLRRRALRTLRPLAVDMRLRKPCLLRRFRTEGWKVLFIFERIVPLRSFLQKGRQR